jgi:DNA repair protein RadC
MKITDWPKCERPREKLLAKGADTLTDSELLAIFLRSGIVPLILLEIYSRNLVVCEGC